MTDTAITEATAARLTRATGHGRASSHWWSMTAKVSSATYPKRMDASVIPSWTAESWK